MVHILEVLMGIAIGIDCFLIVTGVRAYARTRQTKMLLLALAFAMMLAKNMVFLLNTGLFPADSLAAPMAIAALEIAVGTLFYASLAK